MSARPGGSYVGVMPETMFAAPDARELLLPDGGLACPFHPRLWVAGVAVTPAGQHHLIVRAGSVRAYFGPTQQDVQRRAELTARALSGLFDQADREFGQQLLAWWIEQAWETLIDELTEQILHR